MEDLNSNTKYYFRVRASTQAGPGPPSTLVNATTLPRLDVLVPPGEKDAVMRNSLEKGILAGIVLVTFLIIVCTVVLICRER